MTTLRDLYIGSLRLINVVSANEEPSSGDMEIVQESFTGLLESLQADFLNIYTVNPYRFLLVPGQQEYTLGPGEISNRATGANWVIPRPMRVERAVLLQNADIEYPVEPEATYPNYGAFALRNGYDGDNGVAGYIGSVPPFEIAGNYEQTEEVSDRIRNIGASNSNAFVGAGDPSIIGTNNTAVPMEVGSTNSFTATDYGFYSPSFYFPMLVGDEIWISAEDFPGSGQESSVEVFVGPGTPRETYTCTVGSQPYEPMTFSVTRTA